MRIVHFWHSIATIVSFIGSMICIGSLSNHSPEATILSFGLIATGIAADHLIGKVTGAHTLVCTK